MAALETQSRGEWAIMDAEAEVAFAFLTSAPVRGGIYVGAQPFETITTNAGDVLYDRLAPQDIWSGRGGLRRIDLRRDETSLRRVALVSYQDGAGLAAINTLSAPEIEQTLIAAGLPSDAAASFAARILDYADEDNHRRFRGAERADYRLAQRAAPMNSPFRSIEEISSVLGADALLTEQVRRALESYVTTGNRVFGLNAAFAPPALAGAARAHAESLNTAPDMVRLTAATGAFPSVLGRFSILIADGETVILERIIEIERAANAIDKPFRRYWIADRVGSQTSDPSDDQIPRLVSAELPAGDR
ncbi:MAG: hypothetical protein Tsb0010_02060 [Parvularculaceae bacterium]